MNTEGKKEFTSIEQIRIVLPHGQQDYWLTEVNCTNASGQFVKLSLSSVDRYVNIWGLTHDFHKMELFDLFDGKTQYEFGRFLLKIFNGNHVDEQWLMEAREEIR